MCCDYLVDLFISMWFMMSVIVMLVLLAFMYHKNFTVFFDGIVKIWKLVIKHV